MNLEQIEELTRQYGQGWGYAHARRVLQLSELIGADLQIDRQAFAFAVYLHDWGAFPRYAQPGVDHALRSRQVAEAEILPFTGLSAGQQALAAEAIELHDYRDPRPYTSPESLLLREADWLDMLGLIGMAREFAWGPNDLGKCTARIRARIEGLQGRFTLPKAQEIAAGRIRRMQDALATLAEESFGVL